MTEKRPFQPDDLYRLTLISDPQISPDGRRVAFVRTELDQEQDEYHSNVYVVDVDGNEIQYTTGNKDSAPRWSPDGHWLAFLSGRNDTAQIHLMPTSGGESVALTNLKLGAGTPAWSPNSRYIAFAATVSTLPDDATEDKDDKKARMRIIERSSYKLDHSGFLWDRRSHLFVIDIASRTVTQLTDGDYHDNDPAWTPDSTQIAFTSSRALLWDVSTARDIYVIPAAGGSARRVVAGTYGNPVVSPDGKRVAFTGHRDPDDAYGPSRLYSTTLDGDDLRDELGSWDGGVGNDLTSDIAYAAHNLGLLWQDGGLYFLGTVRGATNIYRASNGAVSPVTDGHHSITGFSRVCDGALAYVCSDPTHLPQMYLCCDGQTVQLTHANEEFLREVHLAQPQRITFEANGCESEGWLLPPRGHESGRHPLLLYIHGGPQTAHGGAFHFEYQFLAGQGIGIFFPNIHGSSSYGAAYQTSIRHDWGNLDFKDIMAGIDAAVTAPWVDPDRLGVAGGSYGGYMTNWVVAHTDRFKAALTERCLSNMVSFVGTSDTGWLWRQVWGAFPEDDVQKLWDMSPLKYVGNVTTPLLVMHSEHDDRCPLEQGEQMFNALRRLGKETRLIVFPEECHELSRSGTPSRRVERLNHILAWFRDRL